MFLFVRCNAGYWTLKVETREKQGEREREREKEREEEGGKSRTEKKLSHACKNGVHTCCFHGAREKEKERQTDKLRQVVATAGTVAEERMVSVATKLVCHSGEGKC